MSNPSLFPQQAVDESFGHWLSGFTDGEGSFFLHFGKAQVHVRFAIQLRADDADIIHSIKSFWGCGYIHFRHRKQDKSPMVSFSVSSLSHHINIIVPHFERFPLRAKKAKDFVIWRKGLDVALSVKNRRRRMIGLGGGSYPKWTKSDIDEFSRLTLLLKSTRKYQGATSQSSVCTGNGSGTSV